MSRPPRARDAVLDAFEALLVSDGERAATMDATARAAGVSKGGLLYHFASKDALETGLIERLELLADADVAEMQADEAGMIAAFIRSSVMDYSPLDRTLIAVSKLAQGGSEPATSALRRVRHSWEEALRPATRDETALQLVLLASDGLYFNNSLDSDGARGPVPQGADMDALVALIESAARR